MAILIPSNLIRQDLLSLGIENHDKVLVDAMGNITPLGGVYLGGTAVANKLDDYEEGTWTPTWSDGTNTNATYTLQTGTYTKVGNKVHVQGRITISSLGAISGSLSLIGLPFLANAVIQNYSTLHFGWADGLSITAGVTVTGYVRPNYTACDLTSWDSALGTTAFSAGELSADGSLIFSAEYTT